MRGLACALVIAVFLPDSRLLAQNAGSKTWQWWAIGKNRKPPGSLLVLPNASEAAQKDRAREGAKQRAEDRFLFDKIKFDRLYYYRTERERAVSASIARAAAKSPFNPPRPKRPPPASLATAGQIEGQAAPAIDLSRPELPPPPAVSRPSGTPRPRTPAAVVDQVVQQVGSKIIGTPAGKPLSPGLFALVLVGLFLVPAAAISFLLLGIAHLRGHSFVTGSIIIALGGLLLWGTWSLARTINPDLLAQGQPADPNNADGNLRPMEGLRADLFWNNE